MRNQLAWFVMFALVSVAQAESVFVHSAKAPLFEKPAFNSNQLIVLTKGTELQLLQTDKRWLQVVSGDYQGWVSALLVKSEPPLDQVNLLGSDAVTLEGEARRRASAVATAGATRGLTDSEDAEGVMSDYSELMDMESLLISVDDLDAFAAELIGE